jgi:hypothetical protein
MNSSSDLLGSLSGPSDAKTAENQDALQANGQFQQVADPTSRETQSITANQLAKILTTADQSTKAVILKALGVTSGIKVKKTKKRQDSKAHLAAMRQLGEAYHEDPDFVPVPPEGIVSKGEMAVLAWQQAWREGKTWSAASMDIDDDLETMAQIAVE